MPHFDALKIYSCGKHCEKRRNCLEQAISPFLTMFSTLYDTYFSFYMHFKMSSVICFNLDRSKILLSVYGLNLYHTIPTFNDLDKDSFLKYCGKWRKCWLLTFLLFPHNIFYPINDRNYHCSYIKFVVCKCFKFGPV